MGGDFTFDADAFELRRGSALVELEPQALSVAAYLIENRHRLIPKEELLDEVWGDRFVSESALSTRIKQVRRAFDDNGADQRVVKTIRGKGFRFIGEVTLVRSGDEDLARAEAPQGPAHNLPSLRTALIGRAADLDRTVASVGQYRLTTMLGIGGVGKTSLATAAGHTMVERFDDGVWFVDLVPVASGDQLLLAMAKAAGLSLQAGSAIEQISSIIRNRQALFILDNCEHIVDTVANAVEQLLDATESPRFLLTSREPLGVAGEAQLRINPLQSTGDAHPAVEMLAACAARYGVDLGASDHNAAADVCKRLDGIPLAIELAAAQLRHLTIDDLSTRLGDRLDLLVGIRRADRHTSLTSVLEATWASVSNLEREMLRQLSQCPGTLTVSDIVELMDQPEGTSLASLARLVDCSLVVRSDADARYRVLETVRAFATEAPDARPEVRRDRLADWCLERVGESVSTHSFDCDHVQWCRTHDDVLDTAEAHLAKSSVEQAAMLIAAQGLTVHLDDGSRAAELANRAGSYLSHVDDPGLRSRLHMTATFASMAIRDTDGLVSHGAAAVDMARRHADPSVLAVALVLRSWSALRDPDHALELVGEATDQADSGADQRTHNLAQSYRAWHLALALRYDEAVEAAGTMLSRSGESAGYDTASGAAALATCQAMTNPTEAMHHYTTSVDLPEFGLMPANKLLLASIHAASGATVAARDLIMELHRRLQRAGQPALPDLLVPIAVLAIAQGDMDRARRYTLAVRQSARPTQSFQTTCLYQQLRSAVELGKANDAATSTDDVGADALTWLATL